MEKRGASLCQAMSSSMANDARIRLLSQSDHSGLEIVREDGSSPVSDVDNLCLTEVSKDPLPPCGVISLEVGKIKAGHVVVSKNLILGFGNISTWNLTQ
ncbi:hypothetical protein HS088_TW22G00194 [Tripterygium wilfordii]|uniref:Uncharacterized protein n=1 Tax=Tripterygium wilfordii TaxID=458696 RepID=A0A7J7BY91_TRIWF|nr:hypothetical protein HS088_TW22G00194 [Tripterygium wilfordii]